MSKLLKWPELDEFNQDQLLFIIKSIRERLAFAESMNDFCLELAQELKVDLKNE